MRRRRRAAVCGRCDRGRCGGTAHLGDPCRVWLDARHVIEHPTKPRGDAPGATADVEEASARACEEVRLRAHPELELAVAPCR